MIGEIGGNAERAAAWAADNVTKPIVGFVARTATGKRMGHERNHLRRKRHQKKNSQPSEQQESLVQWILLNLKCFLNH